MKTTSANSEPATGGTPILHQRTRFAMPRLGPWVAAAVILLGGPSALATITTVASYDFNSPLAEATAVGVGLPTYANGQLVLNGSNCLSMASPISVTDNFGMEVICTPTFNDTFNYCLSLNSGANNGWGILQRFGAYQGIEEGIGYFGNAGAGSAVLNVPVRLALVRAGGVTRIYQNGLAVGSSSIVSYSTLTKFTIGGNQLTTAPVFEGFFKGSIDEVRVFTFDPGAFNPVTDLPNRTVVTTTVDEDDGTSALNTPADISLREAVKYSPANSRIVFAPSLSGKTITLGGTQLLITKSLTIDATSLPNGITINANGQSRVMELRSLGNPNFTVALRGLTLTGGQANQGGAIFANGSDPGNPVSLSLTSCTLSGNSASFGGGIFSDGQSNGSATLSLSSCTLSGNFASASGGGILSSNFSGSTTVNLSSCTLSGNSASRGGGIHSEGFSGSATLNLISCTLTGNSASEGGGIFSESGEGGIANVSLNNTILGGNTAPVGPDLRKLGTGAISTVGSNLIGDNSGSTITTAPPLVGTATAPVNPRLSPLGWFGGSTQTMHPLSGSPAILSSANVTRTDQRGFPLTGPPTMGAVMQGPVITVTDEATLRTALAGSANTKGRVIRFNPSLSGQTITLTTGQLLVPGLSDGLFIDASALPNGLTINANGTVTNHRVMEIQPNSTVALHGLTLTGGRATGNSSPADSGGAIFANGPGVGNSVRLSLSSCTLSGNSSSNGGGIYSNGNNGGSATLSLSSCTLSGNSASSQGGGIFSDGTTGSATLSLSSCTLSGNSASSNGGGIFSQGYFGSATLSLSSCTLSGNSAYSQGGGIFSSGIFFGNATLSLSSCTLSGNSASSQGGGIFSDGTTGSATVNLSSCTLSGNSASSFGGGIHSNGTTGSAMLSLNNSILAGNTAPTGPDLCELEAGATTTTTRTTTTATGFNLMSSLNGQDSFSANAPPATITVTADPRLSPLGHYGGPTQTMHPLSGSPAVLTGTVTRTDQRGFTLTGPPTIGAVMQGPVITVTDKASLLTELANSANTKGRAIRFNPSLSGQTITLTDGELLVPGNTDGLFIDASNLGNGPTISGGRNSRVFNIPATATVALHSLNIINGKTSDGANGIDGAAGADGGGILSFGSLTLTACTLSGNQTGNGGSGSVSGGLGGLGGGIYSTGSLTLTACTLSGNQTGEGGVGLGGHGGSGGVGGGIYSTGSLTLTACTLSGNQTGNGGVGGVGDGLGGFGGGIHSTGSLTLTACTLSDNLTGIGGQGGGITSSGNFSLSQSIVAGNTAASNANIFGTFTGSNNLTTGDPKLAPLGNYGGPTQTMPPLPGSPAIDAAVGSTEPLDQRGFPRPVDGDAIAGAVRDLGAAEYTPSLDLPAYWLLDTDGDRNPFGLEFALGTDPAVSDAGDSRNLRILPQPGGQMKLTFGWNQTAKPYTTWVLKRSPTLLPGSFTEIFRYHGPTSTATDNGTTHIITPMSFEIIDTAPPPGRSFYRFEALYMP